MNAGENIKKRRMELGLSQTELARLLHTSTAYMNQIEHNHRGGSISFKSRIADVLGVSLDELVGRTAPAVPGARVVFSATGAVTACGTLPIGHGDGTCSGVRLDIGEVEVVIGLWDDAVRAIGPHLYRKVRLTVEVLDG